MSGTPRTEDRWRDALARPSKQGDWKYVAEEMKRLCEELEYEASTIQELDAQLDRTQEANDDLERQNRLLENEVERTRGANDDLERQNRLLEDMLETRDAVRHLHRQINWSRKTFGPDGNRTKGLVDHIVKELGEILASRGEDTEEWIDVVILALDGAMRHGATPEQIWETLVNKQSKNEARRWPDWRTAVPGKAIEHIREGTL